MSIELKVKSKHLSVEAQIIRFEEQKLHKQIAWNKANTEDFSVVGSSLYRKYCSLQYHRKYDVRNEVRATLLARAYIAGVPYHKVEQKRLDEHLFVSTILPRVCTMVNKYGKRLDGDWVFDRSKGRTVATQQLTDKITEWATLT